MSERLLLGTKKGTILLERGRAGFRVVRHAHAGISVSFATRDEQTRSLWACLDHGHWGQKVQRSDDGAETWKELPAPVYPEGTTMKAGSPGAVEVPAKLRYNWVLEPSGCYEPGHLYMGTVPGGLFESLDDGASWKLVRGLWDHPSRVEGKWSGGGKDFDYAGLHSIVVDPRNRRRILVGVSCAGVFETTDGGATWAPRNKGLRADFLPNPDAEVGQDPHFMAACRASPDVLWQQNHCGVYRSTDGAATWTKISQEGGPVHFGFAIAVDDRNPEVAWVIPASSDEDRVAVGHALCVSRTDDGGKTWTAFREGLPQEHAFDVVYRHAFDVSGDRLAFGSTTGNVFFSTDRGESWHSLGHHFPPVNSVRFV